MPDSRTSRTDQAAPSPEGEVPVDGADDTTDSQPTDAAATGAESTEGEPDGDEPDGFENRAARRAKGKGPSAQQRASHDTTRQFGGRGSVQGPRQWGNRRTG